MSASSFRQSWKTIVPQVYVMEKNRNYPEVRQVDGESVLISTIEQFIAGGDEMLEKLTEMDSPPSMCGRVFKLGEPTYFCRECGKDTTCVLCAECFKHSLHRHHKYKMGTSQGGGCCDCGDVEAWKSHPLCDIHAKGAEQKTESKGFPEDVAERARIAFEAILGYAFDLLTVTHTTGLPPDLKQMYDFNSPGHFCLVLFNDETHSFEQVLSAMAKVMKSPQRDVIEVVNKVDREGRAIVKSAEFGVCKELREELLQCMSRANQQPIKAEVLNVDVISHQYFALKLLSWLHKVVSCSEGLRSVLNSILLGTGLYPGASIVERLLDKDVDLWKSARVAWHRLLMASLLMDYDSKKALAKIFAKKYGTVMKEFIRDDHDHGISIVSLSVQLFTVPTLAHYLIAEERVLFILWNTFFSECLPKLNDEGKLVFERSVPNTAFRRALFILGDIKLLLCATPTAWTDPLRKGFMQGFQHMMKLLKTMQDMDLVKREVAQHVEYEPEWEPVFLLHMRVASIMTLIIDWCASDAVVLVQACRFLLLKLAEPKLLFPREPVRRVYSLAGHEANCIVYDVSEESVSLHLPMSRLLAGLYLHLEKYNKTLSDVRSASATLTVEEMIEHVMRLQVLIAQVHAGMWRRNGYALVTQIGLYNGSKCRTEMLDRDIVLLQMGASLLDSDQFLIQLLNKFNLLNWADDRFELMADEDRLRRTIYLVEEFLGLVITIIGERYMPGVGQVTEDDEIKKDIIQQLCIKPMSHSELSTSFRDEVARENRVEDVIQEVAEFQKPSTGKGVYKLKREYYSDYNVFYYHYTREERSRSEENQRKRRKADGELECCPPPKLPPLTKTFSRLANLLQCDVMMHILRTVLERSANLRAQSFSETQLHKALHLIGYGLQEEEANPDIKFTQAADKCKMEALLEELVKSPRVEALKDLLRWTLQKYQKVKAKKSEEPVAATASEVALQADKEKERRAKMAAEKRAKIMAQMAAMQRSFMKENAKLFSAESELEKAKDASESAMEVMNSEEPVALGEKQTPGVISNQVHTCILCQEDETVSMMGSVLVLAAYVQRSSVLNQCRPHEYPLNPLFLTSSLGLELHTSTCGHMMHMVCWRHYFDNLRYKATRQHRIRQPPSFDIDKKEFLCPLCACLSNAVLPLVPTPQAYLPAEPPIYRETFTEWIRRLREPSQVSWLESVWKRGQAESSPAEAAAAQAAPSSSSSSSAGVARLPEGPGPGQSPDSSSDSASASLAPSASTPGAASTTGEVAMTPSLKQAITNFAQHGLHKMKAHIKVSDERIVPYIVAQPLVDDERLMPYMAWKSCAYTIHSQEWLLRDAGKSLLGHMPSRQHDCLRALTRIMPLLADSSPGLLPVGLLLMDPDKDSYGPCILEWDSFGLLVALTFSHAPRGIPTGKGCEQHAVRLALLVDIVRILLTTKLK